jgi:hypothetical protein
MYCPNCATEVNPDIHYCNSCGFRIRIDGTGDAGIATSLTRAVGWIGVIGLIAFVFIIKLLIENSTEPGAIVAISFMYLGAVFGICAYILSYIKSLHKTRLIERDTEKPGGLELRTRITKQLEHARTPPASVVENTTRTLDKLPLDTK